MRINGNRFNIYLLAALAMALAGGCRSPEKKAKLQLGSLRISIEIRPNASQPGEEVPIYRAHPMMLTVEKTPFLTERYVKEVKVIDQIGGFALSIEFDRAGALLLEQYTSGNPGRHLAIFTQFIMPPEEKLAEGRWLAAPKIVQHITDGCLIFTPDATRAEAEQIAIGLNNVATELKTGLVPKW